MKKTRTVYISVITIFIAAVMLMSFTAYAEPGNETPGPEASVVQSVPEVPEEPSTEPEPSVEQPSEPEISTEPEPSVEPSEEPSAEPEPVSEPDPEPSAEPEPSYETEPSYEPEPSYEQEPSYEEPSLPDQAGQTEVSKQESSKTEKTEKKGNVSVGDPFTVLKNVAVVLPSDKPGFVPEQSSRSSGAAAYIKSGTGSLDFPPVPAADSTLKSPYDNYNDNNSVLMGMIFWSLLGVIITAVLIIIMNFKGNDTEFAFSRKRYHKSEGRGMSGKYKYL